MKTEHSTPEGAVLTRRAQAAGWAIWTLFHAYGAAQSLQSSLNKGAGYVCLALVYGFFAVSALAAPRLVGTFGEMKLMWLSAIPYVVMVAGNVPWLRDILLPACAGVGIAAATLWSSQGLYIGSLARRYVELNPGVKLSDANSLMNSKFYTIFSSSSGFSSLLASVVLMITDSTSGLFVYLTIVGAASVYLIASLVPASDPSNKVFAFLSVAGDKKMLPAPADGAVTDAVVAVPASDSGAQPSAPAGLLAEESTAASWDTRPVNSDAVAPVIEPLPGAVTDAPSSSVPVAAAATSTAKPAEAAAPAGPPRPPSIAYMIRFVLTQQKLRYMIPLLLVVGLASGVFSGVWLGALVGGGYGTKWVGFVAAAYSFASSAATWGWGKLVLRPSFGRARVMAWAFALHMAFLLLFAAAAGSLRQRGATAEGMSPGAALPLLFFGAIIYASADAVWYSQVPATLQTFYPPAGGAGGAASSPDTACAMASIRFFNALGFSIQAAISAIVDGHVATQFYFVAACLGVAGVVLHRLHTRVRSLNGGQAAGASAAAADDAAAPQDASANPVSASETA